MCGAYAHQRELFDDALLHFLHAVVVAVENAARMAQIAVVGRRFAPRERNHGVQISERNAVVRTAGVEAFQFLYLLFKQHAHVFRQGQLGCFRTELGTFALFAVAQLVLDVFQLLLEEIFFLLLVNFAMCALLDLFAETKQLNLTVENA